MDEDFKINEDDIVPYELTYTGHHGFSVITIIGLIFISVLFSKLFPRLIGEVIIPFFIHSESKLYNQIGCPIISEISLLFIPCFSLKFYDSQHEIFIFANSIPNDYRIAFYCVFCFILMSISLISKDICLKSPFEDIDTIFDFILYLLIDCILPSFCEEFVFRGWAFHYLSQKMNKYISIIITSFLFAFFHPFRSWFSYALIFIISACWNYANILVGSILISILSHFFHNFSQTLLSSILPSICDIDSSVSFILWLSSSCILLILFHKISSETRHREGFEINSEETAFLK